MQSYLARGQLEGAQQHLRTLEYSSITPLMTTYTSLIIALILSASDTPANRAVAWDLFAHMRLVVYPTPDRALYNTMILACASGPDPSPERATDLYRELLDVRERTNDPAYEPNGDTFTALIRACCRTRRKGEESHYVRGLEYLRQMLDLGFKPSRKTLHSVLEGAKRVGDLARARWIYLKLVQEGTEDRAMKVNSVSTVLLFQTYATYKPPRQKDTLFPSRADTDPVAKEEVTNIPASARSEGDASPLTRSDTVDFPGPMPLNATQVFDQAHNLMVRIAVAQGKQLGPVPETNEDDADIFTDVELTPFLLNCYLLAVGAHSPFAKALPIHQTLFASCGVEKDGHSYKTTMEFCETPRNKAAGLAAAREFFQEWQTWSQAQESTGNTQAEAVWSSMIRNLARNKLVDEALDLVVQFREAYPAEQSLHLTQERINAKLNLPASKVHLANPIYPETASIKAEAPMLVWSDLTPLHKALADREDQAGLRKLTKVLRTYRKAANQSTIALRRAG